MTLETFTNAQLRAECEAAGLPTYGVKDALIARLNTAAVADVSEDAPVEVESTHELTAEPVASTPEPIPALVASKLILNPEAVNTKTLPVVEHSKHVEATLDAIKARYPELNFQYNSNDEIFTLDGGRQGRVSTTARQPLNAVMAVCSSYIDLARRGNSSAVGSIGAGW